jgi:hypothetical protein
MAAAALTGSPGPDGEMRVLRLAPENVGRAKGGRDDAEGSLRMVVTGTHRLADDARVLRD